MNLKSACLLSLCIGHIMFSFVYGYIKPDIGICGLILGRKYNTTTHDCIKSPIDSIVVSKQQHTPQTTSLAPTKTPPSLASTLLPSTRTPPAEPTLPTSIGSTFCGSVVYHPENATCCMVSSNIQKVHQGKPQHNHVCCSIKVHPRGSRTLPCKHPSMNDRLWEALNKTLPRNAKALCRIIKKENEYQFLLKVGRNIISHGYTVYNATLSRLNSTKLGKITLVRYDKYSPKEPRLRSNKFLILSANDYYSAGYMYDFYLDPKDTIYRVPRKGRAVQKYKAAQKKCRKSRRRRHRKNRII